MTTKTGGSNGGYRVVGTSPIKQDGLDKVTGKARFGADVHLPGMLHGKILRSPHVHARIKSIDTGKAEAHSDVKAVVTSADLFPTPLAGRQIVQGQTVSENVLARDKVYYKGHAVAAIAATSPHVAEELLSLIEVEYEPLPFVSDIEEAMRADAPVLHEHWDLIEGPREDLEVRGNVAAHEHHRFGDVEKGMAEADLVMERKYRTKLVHQGYIEPHAATAWWVQDGHLSIWCTSQGHFAVRDNVARLLGIPVSDISVVPMEVGGGFGGKLAFYLEPVASALSRKSGHPVKMTMSQTEVFEASGPTPGSYVKMKMGVTKEGRITAAQAFIALEAGAFPGAPLDNACASTLVPYNIENIQVDGYDVVNNKPKTQAYRAPGVPVVSFAGECLVDEIAEKLGLDPIEFRLRNAAGEGSRRVDGVKHGRIGAKDVMEAVEAHPHYVAPVDGRNRGRGVGMGFCRNNSGTSCAIANVNPNGTVNLVEGSVDLSGTRVVVAQQLAEVLGLPAEAVSAQVGDTDTIGYTSATGGSGVAFKTGWAVYEAGQDIIRQMVQRAALMWETPEGQVRYVGGTVQHMSDTELRLTFREIAETMEETGGTIVGKANLNPPGASGSYTANIADVEVDPETGKVDILRYTAFQDAGTAIHPAYVEGQMQGGSSQGIGWALNEEYFIGEEGWMTNSSFLDYRIPTIADLPMIDPVIVEVPNPGHPFGVRGVGEASIPAPLATLANAVYRATGVRIYELPLSSASILKAIKDSSGGHQR